MTAADPGRTRPVEVRAPIIDHPTDPVHGRETPDDPESLARAWLPGPGEDRMLMTLATHGRDGFPSTRTVLVSDYDGRILFHTDARSRKVADLRADPRVSLTIVWPGFTRQLVIDGTAVPVGADEAAEAYARRSPYLRALAWVNDDDTACRPLPAREQRWADFAAEHGDELDPPDTWVGFAVHPHRYVFWVSHPAAPSRRIEFVRTAEGWRRSILAG